MKLCKDCIYFDKLRSKLESKQQGKKVYFCTYLNKAIDAKNIKKMTKCDMQYPEKPD